MLPRIVAICGPKRSGKDTIATFLAETHGYEHIKISKKLKDMCKCLFDFSDDQLETDSKEVVDQRWGITPRHAMQFLGTEIMQYKINDLMPSIGRSFWIKSVIEDIRTHKDKKYVISDLRFLHEEALLRDENAFIIKVIRPSRHALMGNMKDNHVSEKEFMEIREHIQIVNCYKSLDEFRRMMLDSNFWTSPNKA